MGMESLGSEEVGDRSEGSQRRGQKVTNKTICQKPSGKWKMGWNHLGTKGNRGDQETLGAEGVLPGG